MNGLLIASLFAKIKLFILAVPASIKAGLLALGLILLSRMPERFKRIVLLTSLHVKGTQENVFDEMSLKKLNEKIHLVVNEDALTSACYFTPRLWTDVDLKALISQYASCNLDGKCLEQQDAYYVSRQLAEKAPAWLKYDKDQMIKDFLMLFYAQPVRV